MTWYVYWNIVVVPTHDFLEVGPVCQNNLESMNLWHNCTHLHLENISPSNHAIFLQVFSFQVVKFCILCTVSIRSVNVSEL